MVPYDARLLLLPGILFGLFISRGDAAPTKYDQQQTGNYNVDAKFENFLFVFLDSDKSGQLSKLAQEALQVLQFNSQTSSRDASKRTPSEKLSEPTVYETEDKDEGREPYHVEIVRIEKEGGTTSRSKHPEKSGSPEANGGEKIGPGTSPTSLEGGLEVFIENKKKGKKTRSLWRNEESHGLVDGPKEESKRPGHIKYSMVDNLAQSEEISKATRPGISLKKQLSRKEEKDVSSVSEERNELTNKSQELVLLGGGIENCGPGRFRDQTGICQNDKNFY
ncbi:uncharacterized protein LOC143349912 [Colletes latitarsis]|uniref:uncharacterized protein LOC143349912 n=1 Tax=Colletes latitarsis TaxID=2605962 RepID=UPI004035AA2C